jgi:hypothetical protein
LGFGEETLFAYQLREAGYRLVTRFETRVEHHLDPKRLTRAHLLEAAGRMGRSKAYVLYHWHHQEIPGNVAGGSELETVEHAAMVQYIAEQDGRPRNYVRRGLIKLNGLLSAERPQVREILTGTR